MRKKFLNMLPDSTHPEQYHKSLIIAKQIQCICVIFQQLQGIDYYIFDICGKV